MTLIGRTPSGASISSREKVSSQRDVYARWCWVTRWRNRSRRYSCVSRRSPCQIRAITVPGMLCQDNRRPNILHVLLRVARRKRVGKPYSRSQTRRQDTKRKKTTRHARLLLRRLRDFPKKNNTTVLFFDYVTLQDPLIIHHP